MFEEFQIAVITTESCQPNLVDSNRVIVNLVDVSALCSVVLYPWRSQPSPPGGVASAPPPRAASAPLLLSLPVSAPHCSLASAPPEESTSAPLEEACIAPLW
ncbi:hypothetical protein AVEN_111273-1 [Araneus ventricosus]|uniref:Uncharacterized protein n=1 Tax=Araneus ventricosus TaxID=182803 RepID=A0A4Y2X5T3_ARAVE|nr:hypothetical protein AVEN_111273-1 [Araneus ventricosus]